MAPLRQRMVDDMKLRGLSANTQHAYLVAIRQLAKRHHRSPDRINEEELRAYLLYLKDVRKLARSTITVAICAIKFLYERTLQKLLADSRWLGARPGMLAVLHSWTRDMRFHPHAHFLVTAGGMTDHDQAWRRPARWDFLIPCRALSVIFRAKVRQALDQAKPLDRIPCKAWKRKWVTHCRHAGDGEKALLYVARYIHRIAITNSRLESVDPQQVTSRYRDGRSGQLQRCTLFAEQFISRFLQHVLPCRFTKVRYYGVFSPACRDALERARSLLRQTQDPPAATRQIEDSPGDTEPAGSNHICPVCHVGRMTIVADLTPQRQHPTRLRAPPEAAA